MPAGCDVLLGNGSDEIISMVSVACAQPGAKVLAPVPGFVMYQMSAKLANLEFIGVPLQADFTLDTEAMLAAIAEHQPAIIYLAYPNNPTGTLYDDADMERIIAAATRSLVVIDEAYQPFAQKSWLPRADAFDNVVVMRTVSKLGLAGIRLGYLVGKPALADRIRQSAAAVQHQRAHASRRRFPARPRRRARRASRAIARRTHETGARGVATYRAPKCSRAPAISCWCACPTRRCCSKRC